MGIVSITGDSLDVVSDFVRPYVQIKWAWADSWQTVSYLEALTATQETSPGTPSATLLYRYGSIKREDKTTFEQYDPLDIVGAYVRIRAVMSGTHTTLWVGVATDETFYMHGADTDPQGDQTITCYGLEHILDRVAIRGAYTDSGWIGWCPPFNRPDSCGGGEILGNCSGEKSGNSYVFSRDAHAWTNYDICEYLLEKYCELPVYLDGQADVLDELYGVYYFENLTIRQALDKLIERRRGLGWYIETDGTGNIALVVFSVFADSITLGGTTYPGNPATCSLDLGESIDVGSNSTKILESAAYDTIVIQGARMVACFTVSVFDGNLVAGWSPTLEAEYQTPPGMLAGEDKTETDKRRAANMYEPVYQRFVIPAAWDWTASLGDGTGATYPVVSSFLGVDPWDYPRPLKRWIPIKKETPTDAADEWEEPFVWVQDSTDNKYHLVDNLPQIKKPGAHVRMLDTDRGFALKGKYNHLFGLGHFTATTSEDTPVYDYESLVATVAIDTDLRLEQEVSFTPEGEVERVMVIECHDAEYWYIVPGTIVRGEDGEFTRTTSLEIVRDDSAKVKALASLAAAWYGVYRAAVRLDLQRIGFFAPIGGIVEEITSAWHKEPVNTVLTSRTWDFQRQSTTIETGYADLDVKAMMDIPGMSDFRSVGRAFNRLQGWVAGLAQKMGNLPTRLTVGGGEEDTSAVVTVDFWVDLFDRADADSLGDYWTYSGKDDGTGTSPFVVRSGNAYGSEGGTSYYYQSASSYTQINTTSSDMTIRTGLGAINSADGSHSSWGAVPDERKALYASKLSNQAYTVKITFRLPPVSITDTNTAALNSRVVRAGSFFACAAVRYTNLLMDSSQQLNVLSSCFYSPDFTTTVDGFTYYYGEESYYIDGFTTDYPEISTASVSVVAKSAAILTGESVFTGNRVSFVSGGALPNSVSTYTKASNNLIKTAALPDVEYELEGSNSLEVHVDGGEVTVTINGVEVFSMEQSHAIEGTVAGLISNYNNLLLESGYIESIKAWVDGTPEPPDQSGHGKYNGSAHVYADKYHTTNATGTVTYDPTA